MRSKPSRDRHGGRGATNRDNIARLWQALFFELEEENPVILFLVTIPLGWSVTRPQPGAPFIKRHSGYSLGHISTRSRSVSPACVQGFCSPTQSNVRTGFICMGISPASADELPVTSASVTRHKSAITGLSGCPKFCYITAAPSARLDSQADSTPFVRANPQGTGCCSAMDVRCAVVPVLAQVRLRSGPRRNTRFTPDRILSAIPAPGWTPPITKPTGPSKTSLTSCREPDVNLRLFQSSCLRMKLKNQCTEPSYFCSPASIASQSRFCGGGSGHVA